MSFKAPHAQGFSLIEIVIAMVIFAVISSMCYSLLTNVITTRQRTQSRNIALAQMQDVMQLFQRDIMHFSNRPITVGQNLSLSAFFIDREAGMFEFSRAHAPNAFSDAKSSLQRVRYRIAERQLIRDFWQRVDYSIDTVIGSDMLLNGVEHMTLYVWQANEFQRDWIPVMTTDPAIVIAQGIDETVLNTAPAMKLELLTDTFGIISKSVLLPADRSKKKNQAEEQPTEGTTTPPANRPPQKPVQPKRQALPATQPKTQTPAGQAQP
jgi:general secretion pathway protein J